MKNKDLTFVVLDDRGSVIRDLCARVSENMDATGLQLPPAWTSKRELLESLWHLNDTQQTTISHIIDLTNELSREDFRNGLIWQELVDHVQLITHNSPTIPSPLEQFEIVPLIDLKIGNFDFSFTNPSFFMLLTLSLVLLLLLILFMEKEESRKRKSLEWREKRRKITFGSSSASDDSSNRKKPEEEELEKEEKKRKHYETLAYGARLSLIHDISSFLPQNPHFNKVNAILVDILGADNSNFDRLVNLSQEVLEKKEHSEIVKSVLRKLLE